MHDSLGLQIQILQTTILSYQVLLLMLTFVSNPGWRRYFGDMWVKDTSYFETVTLMMRPTSEGGNPTQFYRLFRMLPSTFEWFEDHLWESTKRRRQEERVAAGQANTGEVAQSRGPSFGGTC